MKEWSDFISKVDVFFGLGSKERDLLLASSRQISIRKKEHLFAANSPADHVYVLTKGAVKTVRSNGDGQRLLVDFVKDGDLVGEDALLFANDYDLDAYPFDSAVAIAIPCDDVKGLLDKHPRLGRAFAALAAARARQYRERLYLTTTASVPSRIGSALYLLSRRFGRRVPRGILIDLKLTHQDLADYVGASRETVTLALCKLKENGVLVNQGRKMIVSDLKGLKKIAQA